MNLNPINLFRERIWIQVVSALTVVLLVIIASIIGMNIRFQDASIHEQSRLSSQMLTATIEGSTFDSLAAGRNDEVAQQMHRLKEKVPSLDITIFDFGGTIVFTTIAEAEGKPLRPLLKNKEASDAVGLLLAEGKDTGELFDERIDGASYISTFKPIPNEPRCHHCHGSSRRLLGGLHVRSSAEQAVQLARSSRNQSILVGTVGCLVFGLAIYLFFQRMVNRPLERLLDLAGKMRRGDLTHSLEVRGHNEISHMTARMNLMNRNLREMITEIARASSSLSATATEQAASLEETSAALEEMASTTTRNAQDAVEADHLMRSAREMVDTATQSMSQLIESMERISGASEDTSKIIKTIDEIAFQTNLLALNAAVEAARAGEAGAGFAVVAEEVRSLAMRAAEAARTTTVLISETARSVKEGSGIVSATARGFSKLEKRIVQAAEVAAAIAASSKEQALGIEQINKAVVEMDGATQSYAAMAEELASSAGQFRVTFRSVEQPCDRPSLEARHSQSRDPSEVSDERIEYRFMEQEDSDPDAEESRPSARSIH